MTGLVAARQIDRGRYHIIKAIGLAAIITNKMDVVVLVMTFFTIVLADCIPDGIICRGNCMNDPLINKGLKRAVNRHAVEFFASPLFNVTMGKRTALFQEKLQYLFPAVGDAQAISL